MEHTDERLLKSNGQVFTPKSVMHIRAQGTFKGRNGFQAELNAAVGAGEHFG